MLLYLVLFLWLRLHWRERKKFGQVAPKTFAGGISTRVNIFGQCCKTFFDIIYETTVTTSVKMLANTLIAALNMQKYRLRILTQGPNVIKLLNTNLQHYRHNLNQSHKRYENTDLIYAKKVLKHWQLGPKL